jgi:hypothetical protein
MTGLMDLGPAVSLPAPLDTTNDGFVAKLDRATSETRWAHSTGGINFQSADGILPGGSSDVWIWGKFNTGLAPYANWGPSPNDDIAFAMQMENIPYSYLVRLAP